MGIILGHVTYLVIKSYSPTFNKVERELLTKIDHYKRVKKNDELVLKLEALSSTTIRSSDDSFKKWINASLYIEELNESEFLNIDSLIHLNFLLTGNRGLRKESIHAGYSEFPEARDLEDLLESFIKEALSIDNNISKAAFIYQCLVSIHPFSDGNGRLSRLVASKILTENNYMPLAFSDQGAGFVIPKVKEENYHYIALKKVLVSHSWLSRVSTKTHEALIK